MKVANKDELLANLQFYANPNGYVLWKLKNKDSLSAENRAYLDELVEDKKITHRRTKANNLSIRVLPV